MVQEGADMGERLPEDHAVCVLRQMHDQLIQVVQEAMRDCGNPDGVLRAIDEAVRQRALAAREAFEDEAAEGDLDSGKIIGITMIVTGAGVSKNGNGSSNGDADSGVQLVSEVHELVEDRPIDAGQAGNGPQPRVFVGGGRDPNAVYMV